MSIPAPNSVTIAHLSDVHLPPPAAIPLRELRNKRLLSLMSWKKHRQHRHLGRLSDAVIADIAAHGPDMIANSGDLTNFGLPEEFVAGAAWLSSLPAPTCIVPGNHDCMVAQPWAEGLAHWSPWMTDREKDFPYCRQIGDVVLIGVNSGIPSPPFMAYGRVGRAQTRRLRDLLHSTRGLCRVVMIHHPPRPGLVVRRKSLLDQRYVAAALREAGAEIVLHGHSHDSTITTIPQSDIPLLGIASASLRSLKPWRQAAWNELTIHREENTWRIALAQHRIRDEGGSEVAQRRVWQRPCEQAA
ncbi:metallophosphoesterase family protein [Kozakia baliensis]|uniref:metallophosphoesterase family protein n=1 Tax=Kozakia baliensis TaxID=153496 RepID=UPI0004958BD8|nr:metallophosphoesterase [Kozakia baliensis]